MIKIKDLKVGIENKEILKGVSLNFELGKNYCLLGKNGSGKSTLSAFLMGDGRYKYISGKVEIIDIGQTQGTAPTENGRGEPCVHPNKQNLIEMTPEERSQAGLFLSFQNVPEIKGIRLSEYLRIIYNIHLKNSQPKTNQLSPFIFKRFIKKYLEELDIDESFLNRELNVGFSGGEKRKIEILQMKLIGPKYIILDEIDSGLDLDAFRSIAELLKQLSNENNTLIIITHYFKILDYIDVDKVFVIKDGKIVKEGDKSLVEEVKEKGYK